MVHAMKRLWFKAKRYGYGWYPATWEGWAVTIGFVALALLPSFILSSTSAEQMADARILLVFLPYILLITTALLLICYKTGEKPRWRWGGK